jgi:hypothetical protein
LPVITAETDCPTMEAYRHVSARSRILPSVVNVPGLAALCVWDGVIA